MAASVTSNLQIYKRPHIPRCLTDLDETGINIHGLLRYFILNIITIRVAVPFKLPPPRRQKSTSLMYKLDRISRYNLTFMVSLVKYYKLQICS